MDIKIGEEQYKYRLIGCPINIPRASDYGITQNDITEKYQYDKQYEEYSTKAQNFCDNITFVMGYILLLCEIVYYFFFSGKIHFHLPFTNNIYNIFALAGYVLLFFWLGFFPAGAQGQILRLIIPDKTFRAFAHLFYKEPQIPSKFPMVESYMNAYKDFITNKAPKLKKEYNGIEKYNYNTTLFGYNTKSEFIFSYYSMFYVLNDRKVKL
ncbi:MAG: hypothetical protein IKQ72_04345 [Bacteroidaceae bacterium]|nr:hypothetical protein [Bacteroidaceae bacterium]